MNTSTASPTNWLRFIIVLVLILIVVLIIWLVSLHLGALTCNGDKCVYTYSKADLGSLGDLVGGILNPILSFGTVAILIYSLLLQREELMKVTEQLKQTTLIHEQTMALHERNNILSNLEAATEQAIDDYLSFLNTQIRVFNEKGKAYPSTVKDLIEDENILNFALHFGFKWGVDPVPQSSSSSNEGLEKLDELETLDKKLFKYLLSMYKPFEHLEKLSTLPYLYIQDLESISIHFTRIKPELRISHLRYQLERNHLRAQILRLIQKANEL